MDARPAPASDKERPSQDDLNRWVDDWRYASSLVTQPCERQSRGRRRSR